MTAGDNPFLGKKILIIHFRVGKTDGVSIEIDAWKEILTRAGAEVKLCSGPVNNGADFVISNLEQQLIPDIYHLDEAAFHPGIMDETKIISAVTANQKIIESELNQILTRFQPNQLIISNIFSVGEHISAAGAFTHVLDQWKVPTLGVHHDFWWESIRRKEPSCGFVKNQLEEYFPPIRPWLKHAVINSIAQTSLKTRKNLDSVIIPDTIDFNLPLERRSQHPQLLDTCLTNNNDILILQATRIVRRKNIEIAVDICHELSKQKNLNRRVKLVLAGYAEKRDEKYRDLLFKYAEKLGVAICDIGSLINSPNSCYTLWDAYPKCDLVSYPSEYEGFGNQFLEAIYAQKPIALFEYPVFKADIKDKGFAYVSLGDKLITDEKGLKHLPPQALESACKNIVLILTNRDRHQNIVEKNFRLGKQNYSYEKTLSLLINSTAKR